MKRWLLASALWASVLPVAHGQGSAAPRADATAGAGSETPARSALPLWELGAVGITASQQAYPGSDQQTRRTLLLPYFVYRGLYLRADRDNFGLRAVKTPRFEVDVGFGGSLGSDSDRIDARRGMPDLGDLVEAGPRLRWNLVGDADSASRVQAQFALRGVLDLSDGLAHRGFTFEPRLGYESRLAGNWRWGTSASVVFGDRRLARTLYGVAPEFAIAGRPAYEAKSGVVAWRLSANASTNLTPDVRVFGFVRLDTVEGAANRNSPLVRQNSGASVGIGLTYTFKRSASPAYE